MLVQVYDMFYELFFRKKSTSGLHKQKIKNPKLVPLQIGVQHVYMKGFDSVPNSIIFPYNKFKQTNCWTKNHPLDYTDLLL